MLITVCLFTICCSLLIAIEQIEQSGRPQRVLEEGIHSQLELLNDIMKVCFTCCYLLYQLTKVPVYHFPDGLVHPDHCHIEDQSGYLLPQDRCPTLATKGHLCCHSDLHNFRHRFCLRCCLSVRHTDQFFDQGSHWSVYQRRHTSAPQLPPLAPKRHQRLDIRMSASVRALERQNTTVRKDIIRSLAQPWSNRQHHLSRPHCIHPRFEERPCLLHECDKDWCFVLDRTRAGYGCSMSGNTSTTVQEHDGESAYHKHKSQQQIPQP